MSDICSPQPPRRKFRRPRCRFGDARRTTVRLSSCTGPWRAERPSAATSFSSFLRAEGVDETDESPPIWFQRSDLSEESSGRAVGSQTLFGAEFRHPRANVSRSSLRYLFGDDDTCHWRHSFHSSAELVDDVFFRLSRRGIATKGAIQGPKGFQVHL